MPQLSAHQSTQSTKMLLIGDPGAGKSGSLASLAEAGYNLRVLDLDSGLDILSNLLRDPKSPYDKAALGRVIYETVTDPMKPSGGKLVPVAATVWQRSIELLQRWKMSRFEGEGATRREVVEYDLGSILAWGPRDVLVIDSLTMLCNGAMNFILKLNARLGQQPHQSDWYAAQQLVESLLQMLYDENVKCNVILISHVTYIGEENGPQHGYPASLGKALSPKIGRYFNSCLMLKTTGAGANVKRKILTQSTQMVELKNTNPLAVQPEYDIRDGLAQYFAAVRGITLAELKLQLAGPEVASK